MSLSKNDFLKQQQHDAEAAHRAAQKQAEIAADLEKLHNQGSAGIEDIERLQKQQADLAEDLEILRKREQEGGANYY
ncbi:MAG: hypothetical protein M3209_00080 [Acidobacteriota bacterium]|nr:hypothetical protein [Acidobacteriota bacterium]